MTTDVKMFFANLVPALVQAQVTGFEFRGAANPVPGGTSEASPWTKMHSNDAL